MDKEHLELQIKELRRVRLEDQSIFDNGTFFQAVEAKKRIKKTDEYISKLESELTTINNVVR